MEKIPTAEDFLQDHLQISHFYDDNINQMVCYSSDVQQAMVEFAKLHVEAALKEASKKVKRKEGQICDHKLTESILNSYPVENIK